MKETAYNRVFQKKSANLYQLFQIYHLILALPGPVYDYILLGEKIEANVLVLPPSPAD